MHSGVQDCILFIRIEGGFGGGGSGGGGGYTGGNGSARYGISGGGGGGSYNKDKNATATLGWFDEGKVEIKVVKKFETTDHVIKFLKRQMQIGGY